MAQSVAYRFDTPFRNLAVTVRHNAEGLSAAHQHDASEESPLAPDSDARLSISVQRYRFAGPRTQGRLSKHNLDMLEVMTPDPLERGARYVDDYPAAERYDPADHGGQESWAASDISAEITRGDRDMTVAGLEADHYVVEAQYTLTTFDADGAETGSRTVEHAQDVWFSDELPYSPLQLYPGLPFGYALSGSGKSLIDRAVIAELEPRMGELGAVVRTEQPAPDGFGDPPDPVVIELSDLQETEPFALESLDDAPVVPEPLFNAVAGPLFIAEMLSDDDAISDEGGASLGFGAPADIEFDAGRAGYKTTGAGDFAAAIAGGGPGEDHGLVVVMRPVNGAPEPGDYDVAPAVRDSAELEAMDAQALAERAERFQAFGVVERDGVTYVVMGFVDGGVTIESGADDRVSGRIDADVRALRTDTGEVVDALPIEASFEAVEGLEALHFRSPESRFIEN
ncbi:hypothetical protein DDZ18_04885 [Marinicauda salina]|uniref:Uncharacterized protein n=2 Tax=Marinicauda salina TaxID=2135793 RepID=A0A2U2BVC0_9PROT|nr:hypothetical protein DDZ18_04885 [Marinicauda salina]